VQFFSFSGGDLVLSPLVLGPTFPGRSNPSCARWPKARSCVCAVFPASACLFSGVGHGAVVARAESEPSPHHGHATHDSHGTARDRVTTTDHTEPSGGRSACTMGRRSKRARQPLRQAPAALRRDARGGGGGGASSSSRRAAVVELVGESGGEPRRAAAVTLYLLSVQEAICLGTRSSRASSTSSAASVARASASSTPGATHLRNATHQSKPATRVRHASASASRARRARHDAPVQAIAPGRPIGQLLRVVKRPDPYFQRHLYPPVQAIAPERPVRRAAVARFGDRSDVRGAALGVEP
jgi:hypothetical protein